MRILLSAYACEPDRGSEPGYGWNWATHLARAGHEVWVLTRARNRAAIEPHLRAHPVEGLHVRYVGVSSWIEPVLRGQTGVFARYFLWQRAIVPVARRLHEARPFDLVHHVTWGSLTGGSMLAQMDVPFVFGPVGGGQVAPTGFREILQDGWRSESVRSAVVQHVVPRLPFLRRTLRRTTLLLATNRDTKQLAERLGARRVEFVVDSGLPPHFFPPSLPERPATNGALRALWVGRLLPRKALRLSLMALARTATPVRLTILGDGPQGEHVPAWIREFGLDDRVEWRGQVPWGAVKEAYRTHDVFLFNSLRDSFGSQLMEAMANGLPVVTLDLHGARDFVPDTAGVKVPVTTPDATATELARALDELANQPAHRRQLAAAGFRYARSFDWAAKARRITALYEQIAQPASPPPPDGAPAVSSSTA